MHHCTAKSKRSGQRCRNKPVTGRTVCRMHGGNSRRGIAHPNFQTGRYTKDLPKKLAEQYQASLESQALTSLREDLGLCDIRLSELLGRLTEKREPLESPVWGAIMTALAQRRKLVDAHDKHAIIEQKYVPVEEVSQFMRTIATVQKSTILKHTDHETASMLLTRIREAMRPYIPSQNVGKNENSEKEGED